MELVRKNDGCYKLRKSAWGSFYQKTEDPEASPINVDNLTLIDPFPRLDADNFAAIIDLYWKYCKRGWEVQVLLLRNLDDTNLWKVVVPRQTVTGSSVHSPNFADSCDILTGEPLDQWEPEGWVHSGSSHTHCQMSISWSPTDDKHELGVGGLHFITKSMNLVTATYELDVSIVQNKRRFVVSNPDLVIDRSPSTAVAHPRCETYVTQETQETFINKYKPVKGKGYYPYSLEYGLDSLDDSLYADYGWDYLEQDNQYLNKDNYSSKYDNFVLLEMDFEQNIRDLLRLGHTKQELINIVEIQQRNFEGAYDG